MLKPTSSMPKMQGNLGVSSVYGAGMSSTSVSGLSASYPGQGELLRYQKRESDFETSPRPQKTHAGNGYVLTPTVPLPAIVSSARAERGYLGTASPGRHSPAISSGSPERKPKDFTVLRNDFDAQARSAHPAHRVFPEGDPRIPPMRHPGPQAESSSSQAKRTIFTPYELSILQDLWTKGAYYPAHWQVEQVQRSTGLTRVQIRNWFANKRQRAVGEEKARVIRMGNDLAP